MIILGLLLLAAAAVAAVELIVANDDAQITVHMWRWSWTGDAFWLAVAGAAILAAAVLGLLMMKAGSGRERRLRRERRALAKENRQLAQRAELAENPDADSVRDGRPEAYDAPRQGYDAPRQGYDAPRQGYDAPRQGYDAPRQGDDAPRRTEYDRPAEDTHAGDGVERRPLDR